MPESQQESGETLRRRYPDTLRPYLDTLDEAVEEEQLPGIDLVTPLIHQAIEMRATDIHFDPYGRDRVLLRLRIDGVLIDIDAIESATAAYITNQIKAESGIDPVTLLHPTHGHMTVDQEGKAYGVRVTAVPCTEGEKITLRLLHHPKVISDLNSLGFNDEALGILRQWFDIGSGIVAVAGPTGSGKTTTLYALLHEMAQMQSNILTIEDPVEYEIPGINQMQVNEQQGLDFVEGMKAMLRMDPDYLLLGEVREPQSAQLAIEAATSGRGMLCTLHSKDAAGAVSMLRNFDISPREIAMNLSLVISQRLVRKLCSECAEQDKPTADERKLFSGVDAKLPKKLWRPKGCESCNGIGYRGRTAVFELWQIAPEDVELIAGGGYEHELRKRIRDKGHNTLLDDALDKVSEGVTSLEEVVPLTALHPET